MGLFGINYELEKGTSFGFGNVCGSSGSGGFPPAHCCLVYVFIQLSPHSPPYPCWLRVQVTRMECQLHWRRKVGQSARGVGRWEMGGAS